MAAERKKNRLKTSVEIYNRLLWDDTLGFDKSQIEIIHYDKYQKLKSMPLAAWTPIDKGGDIPFHRIAQFTYNNMILWDRKHRIDNINKNSGHYTLDLQHIQHHNKDDNIIGSNIQNIKNYADPMDTSEYIADRQFLSLLKMKPKNMLLLFETLNRMIDSAFITMRPNSVEVLARYLCFKYLSFIDTLTNHKYYLFGSAKIALDTHKSDLDIKIIPSKDTKITTRDQCIQLLQNIKNEFLKLKTLQYTLNGNDKNSENTKYIALRIDDFKTDQDNDKICELQNKIHKEKKSIHQIYIRLSSIQITDSIIPRCMLSFDVTVRSKKAVLMHCTVPMDITVSIDTTGHETMRDKHLSDWIHKYNEDKRIHKLLFAVKLWAQHFKVNSSVRSTINGYGWLHIGLFVLTQNYKQNEGKVYSDIDIPRDIDCAALFILFIDMLHYWICYDETKEHNPQTILRSGINVVTGEWIANNKEYALFVLDPFYTSGHLPDNLAKCVRQRKGIPLLINAIKSSVQQLQFAADESIQRNEHSICKYIEFFQDKDRSIHGNDEREEEEDKEDEEENVIKYYSWKELCNLNLNIPKRRWIQQCKRFEKEDDIITFCEFNCLAQGLTSGTTDRTTFKTDKKYLKWNHRSKRILYEILQYKSDIICLCEVDQVYFNTFYYPNLSKSAFKYDGIYFNKNNPNEHQTINKKKKRRSPKDGVAIFWNSTKFSCYNKYEVILGKPKKCYHIALSVRLKYKNKEKSSKEFDVWCTHLKAGRNNKAEQWRLSQVNTLLYYIRKYSYNVPILFGGDLNAHFEELYNDFGDLVQSKVYPALLNGKVKSKSDDDKNEDDYMLRFESLWNNDTRNTFSTWAGWKDREVKCCLDYIMIGDWIKTTNQPKINDDEKRMFHLVDVLDVWEEKEIQKFDCKLPNKIYPSDHILIAARIAIKTE